MNSYYLAVRYTCVDGDTWEAVAREFGMDAEVLRKFNKAETLRAGAVIDLRGEETPQLGAGGSFISNPDGTSTYTVAANDTFSGISSRFGVPAYALRGANVSLSGKGAELLAAPGEQLTIPGTR
ncbi:LysM peptidoglycan-binding domain-containing protein [Arthrobacter sp. Hor0625]|uniref:LysM peptidoglycan-binding domain-containing protein n=1 Tax=Arthrobacter sp. Hor0625 TaxID=3457358 RepID=UPI00403EB0A3